MAYRKQPPAADPAAAKYEARKERERHRQADASASGRDIGPIPPVAHPRRKKACARDLHRFCTTYLAHSFPLPFCEDHLALLEQTQRAVLNGGLKAQAMPRGSGKTTLFEAA